MESVLPVKFPRRMGVWLDEAKELTGHMIEKIVINYDTCKTWCRDGSKFEQDVYSAGLKEIVIDQIPYDSRRARPTFATHASMTFPAYITPLRLKDWIVSSINRMQTNDPGWEAPKLIFIDFMIGDGMERCPSYAIKNTSSAGKYFSSRVKSELILII